MNENKTRPGSALARVAVALSFLVAEAAGAAPSPPTGQSPEPVQSANTRPTSATAADRVDVGVNLEGVHDWARLLPFTDLMKGSRTWGSAKTPWVHDVPLDPLGWPTQDAGVIVRIAQADPGDTSTANRYMKPGVYQLSFVGKAVVRPVASASVTIRNLAHNPSTNRSSAEIIIGATATQLMLSFEGTRGGVREVSVLQPGYTREQTFTREFLEAIAPFSTLRMMDFLATNGNPVTSWADRTLPASATQSGKKGGAIEYAIQMANEAGKDIWINIPVAADDGYVRSLAELLKESLDPRRAVYVEFSNEVWNFGFAQTGENIAAAIAEAVGGDVTLTRGAKCTQQAFKVEGNCNPFWAGQFRAGKRIARISETFAAVFGRAAMNHRVRPIFATQFANRSIAEQVLKNMATYHGKPGSVLYGIASAPYFSLAKELSQSPDLTADQIFASFQSALEKQLPFFAGGMSVKGSFLKGAAYTGGDWTQASQKAVADFYGIQSLAYEGGPDFPQTTVGLPVKYKYNMDERMGGQIHQFLSQWYGCGNGLFMYYNLSSAYGRHGYWGLTNDPKNLQTTKYGTLAGIARQPRTSFQACR